MIGVISFKEILKNSSSDNSSSESSSSKSSSSKEIYPSHSHVLQNISLSSQAPDAKIKAVSLSTKIAISAVTNRDFVLSSNDFNCSIFSFKNCFVCSLKRVTLAL